MDLSRHSINKAVERFKTRKVAPFISIFCVADVGESVIHKRIDKRVAYDLVSCQFSMHYLFETEQKLRTFFENASARLVPGGYFIGSIPDANALVAKLRHARSEEWNRIHERQNDFEDKKDEEEKNSSKGNGYRFGNRFYSVQFMQDDFLPSDSPFGIEYLFYLEDSVGKKRANGEIEYVPEYLVLFDKFV